MMDELAIAEVCHHSSRLTASTSQVIGINATQSIMALYHMPQPEVKT